MALSFWLFSWPKLKKIDIWGCFGILRISSWWWAQEFWKLMQKWLKKLKLKLSSSPSQLLPRLVCVWPPILSAKTSAIVILSEDHCCVKLWTREISSVWILCQVFQTINVSRQEFTSVKLSQFEFCRKLKDSVFFDVSACTILYNSECIWDQQYNKGIRDFGLDILLTQGNCWWSKNVYVSQFAESMSKIFEKAFYSTISIS